MGGRSPTHPQRIPAEHSDDVLRRETAEEEAEEEAEDDEEEKEQKKKKKRARKGKKKKKKKQKQNCLMRHAPMTTHMHTQQRTVRALAHLPHDRPYFILDHDLGPRLYGMPCHYLMTYTHTHTTSTCINQICQSVSQCVHDPNLHTTSGGNHIHHAIIIDNR